MRAQIPRWMENPGRDTAWVLRAVRLLSNLYDRSGDNERAMACIGAIGTAKDIDALISGTMGQGGASPRDLFIERHWCLAQSATCLHRVGRADEAESWTTTVLNRLAADSSPEALELKIRANYMMGRMLQSSGRPEASEDYLGAALEVCNRWSAAGVTLGAAAVYARYQTAVVLSALARSSVAKNELAKASRQLAIADTMLRETDDQVTRTYVQFLSACVKRQTDRLPEAVSLLSAARGAFLSLRHTRLYNRCSLELGQAFYNAEDYENLSHVLASWGKDRAQLGTYYGDDIHAEDYWDAARRLLVARADLKRNRLPEAATEAMNALQVLERIKPKLQSRAWDRLAVAYAILADIALREGRYGDSVSLAMRGTQIRDGKPPSDTADHAWLLMILAEAHLKMGEPGGADSAHRYLRECQALPIENDFMKKRLDRLQQSFDFFIPRGEKDRLNYQEWETLLRRFLLRRAEDAYPGASIERLAEILHISKQTIYNWKAEFRRLHHDHD